MNDWGLHFGHTGTMTADSLGNWQGLHLPHTWGWMHSTATRAHLIECLPAHSLPARAEVQAEGHLLCWSVVQPLLRARVCVYVCVCVMRGCPSPGIYACVCVCCRGAHLHLGCPAQPAPHTHPHHTADCARPSPGCGECSSGAWPKPMHARRCKQGQCALELPYRTCFVSARLHQAGRVGCRGWCSHLWC